MRFLDFDAARARRAFLAGLGLVYAIAFASLLVQIVGLVGEHGLLPVRELLDEARQYGEQTGHLTEVQRSLPTLCWFDASDAALRLQCVAGIGLATLLFLGVAPLLVLPCLWALYLSLSVAGQEFLSFQWDGLLLETGFFATFLAPWGLLPWGPPRWLLLKGRRPDDPIPVPPTVASVWALRLLLFRFLFASGYVKLSYGDPTWRDLTALTAHYWTQPLPNPIAWWVDHLPPGFQRFSCAAMFAVELGAPWLLFCGWIGRNLFGLATIALMVAITATGNYGFFEPLTIVLALLVMDRPRRAAPIAGPGAPKRPSPLAMIFRFESSLVVTAAAVVALIPFGMQLVRPRLVLKDAPRTSRAIGKALDVVEKLCCLKDERGRRVPQLAPVLEWIEPYRTLNTYGLFRVMTTERKEIVIEGTDDASGDDGWQAYEFRYKPGDPAVAPCFCEPHMPRLDWQMWFAPFGRPPPWFDNLLQRLLRGEPTVLALLAKNPFPSQPPKRVRARLYDYRFSTSAQRAKTGEWWFRVERGLYSPPVSLR